MLLSFFPLLCIPPPAIEIVGTPAPGPVPYTSPLPVLGPELSMTACLSGVHSSGYIVYNELSGALCGGWSMDTATQTFVFSYGDVSIASVPIPTAFDGASHHVGVVVEPLPACECHHTAITFEYIGNGCDQTPNWQSGKFECSGADLSGTASVTTPESGAISAYTLHVGDSFTLTGSNGKVDAQSDFALCDGIVTQYLSIHTSCSKALSVGRIWKLAYHRLWRLPDKHFGHHVHHVHHVHWCLINNEHWCFINNEHWCLVHHVHWCHLHHEHWCHYLDNVNRCFFYYVYWISHNVDWLLHHVHRCLHHGNQHDGH